MLKLKRLFSVLVVSLSCLLVGCADDVPENPNNYKYKAVAGNGWMSGTDYFDYYEKEGNYYKFYRESDSTLIGEWEKPDGWYLSIRLAQSN
jgi:hypothetical protein